MLAALVLSAAAALVSPAGRSSRLLRPGVHPVTMTAVETDQYNQARAAHILVDTEELIDTIREQVEAGVSFTEVASTVSLCTSRSRGGELGWFSAGMMTPDFELACFEGEPGSLIKVQTNFGWHLIRLDDKRCAPTDITPAELKARIDAGDTDGVQFVDVRNPAELELASIPGVDWINMPFNEYSEWGEPVVEGKLLDKEKETIVACHHGMRSKRTSQFFLQNGFSRVMSLKGGVDAYAIEADPSIGQYQNEMKGDECGTCG